jgi:hypothetical protein
VRICREAGNQVTLIVNDNLDDEEINGVSIVSIKVPLPIEYQEYCLVLPRGERTRKQAILRLYLSFHDPELLGVGIKLKSRGFALSMILMKMYQDKFLLRMDPPLFRRIVAIVFELYENRCVREYDMIIVPTPTSKKDSKSGTTLFGRYVTFRH